MSGELTHRSTRDVFPVRMCIDVLAVATDDEYDDGVLWDRAHRALCDAGFISEGGSAHAMDERDVIDGSPLAAKLEEARRG